jgi:hypothetical protein
VENFFHSVDCGVGFCALGDEFGAPLCVFVVGGAHGGIGRAALGGDGVSGVEQNSKAFELRCSVVMTLIVREIGESGAAAKQHAAYGCRRDPHPLQVLNSEHRIPSCLSG